MLMGVWNRAGWILALSVTLAASCGVFAAEGDDPVDMNRAREILRKQQGGEKISAEDQAYLDKARKQMQGGRRPPGGEGGGGQGGAPANGKAGQAARDTTGMIPLTELGTGNYKGEDGGLYGGGKNDPPEAHAAAARKELAKIVPLDAKGQPAKDGRIVFVSISMSNCTQEFSTFKPLADADPEKSPLLTIVDCAQGGRAMAQWAPPDAQPWTEAERRIKAAGVTPEQIQVAWVKLANMGPRGELAEHGKKLEADTEKVVQNAKKKFPNLRIAYLGSRIYGGYATGGLNPEPYAYEGAFPTRWLILDQIKGKAELNYDAAKGEVKAPLLLWGPYLWGDGMTARKSDGLVWKREDLAGDGVHPTDSGRRKVADLLLKFLKTDPFAKSWFLK